MSSGDLSFRNQFSKVNLFGFTFIASSLKNRNLICRTNLQDAIVILSRGEHQSTLWFSCLESEADGTGRFVKRFLQLIFYVRVASKRHCLVTYRHQIKRSSANPSTFQIPFFGYICSSVGGCSAEPQNISTFLHTNFKTIEYKIIFLPSREETSRVLMFALLNKRVTVLNK